MTMLMTMVSVAQTKQIGDGGDALVSMETDVCDVHCAHYYHGRAMKFMHIALRHQCSVQETLKLQQS